MPSRASLHLLVAILGAVALADATLAQPAPPGPGLPPSPPIGPTSLEPNVDRPGQDYSSFELPRPDVELCRSTCDNDARCVAYTYAHPGIVGPNAACWLKGAAPPPVANPCCISGAR
jgi:hypothetical protein